MKSSEIVCFFICYFIFFHSFFNHNYLLYTPGSPINSNPPVLRHPDHFRFHTPDSLPYIITITRLNVLGDNPD